METSGVQRLIAYARELGVEAARPGARRETSPTVTTPSETPSRSDGLRVSLSALAIERSNEAPGSDAMRNDEVDSARASKPARGSALDAYQRMANARTGDRVTIRA